MATTKWVLDPTHSEMVFKVKHLMITNLKGEFRSFNAEIISDGDEFSKATVNATIDATSIYTNQDQRDGHLRGPEFFDVENHKTISFNSTSLTRLDDQNFLLKGMLTIKGVSNEISLQVEFGGINKDPWGNMKAGFSASGKINRKEWGLNWNAPLETGGLLVSDEVRLNLEVQFVKQG